METKNEKLNFKREYTPFFGYVEELPIYVEEYYLKKGFKIVSVNKFITIKPMEEVWKVDLCNGFVSLHKTKNHNFLLLVSEDYDNIYECVKKVFSLVKKDSIKICPACPECPASEVAYDAYEKIFS